MLALGVRDAHFGLLHTRHDEGCRLVSGKAGQRCQERTQLSARTVTAGDEVHVIPGGHRPAIIGSTNPAGELQLAGVGDGRTHVCCVRDLAPKEDEREQGREG